MTTAASAPTQALPAADFDPLELLEFVHLVAEVAAGPGGDPLTVPTRTWDAARALVPDVARAPAARRIAETMGLPWRKVLELAAMSGRARSVALGHAMNEREGNWLTEDYAAYLLQLMAARLGVRILSLGQFRSERRRLVGAVGRRRSRLRMPTEHQIEAMFGTWDKALAYAGLRPRPLPGGYQGERSRTIVEILDLCYSAHGVEPTFRGLERFAIASGMKFPRRVRPWGEYLAEWKQQRRAAGLPVPDGPPSKGHQPDYSAGADAEAATGRRRKFRWTEEEVVAWVARYLAQLRGRPSSQRDYGGWASDQDGAPGVSTIGRCGGWNRIRGLAQQQQRAEAQSRRREGRGLRVQGGDVRGSQG